MKLIDVTRQFKSDEDCLIYIEKVRWPSGEIVCVHCGEIGHVSTITRQTKGDNKRTRIFQCLACGKQFSAASGTIFIICSPPRLTDMTTRCSISC
jgi:DNA-directed RNA polymerase subunit M/transcription elongation factor TFIIS